MATTSITVDAQCYRDSSADLHDPANVSMPDLLVGLTALDHQTNLDVLLHIASIVIHTQKVITTLECLII